MAGFTVPRLLWRIAGVELNRSARVPARPMNGPAPSSVEVSAGTRQVLEIVISHGHHEPTEPPKLLSHLPPSALSAKKGEAFPSTPLFQLGGGEQSYALLRRGGQSRCKKADESVTTA